MISYRGKCYYMFLAYLAKKSDRQEDRIRFLRAALTMGQMATDYDIKIVHESFKDAMKDKRKAWHGLEKQLLEPEVDNGRNRAILIQYMNKIIGEMRELCHEVLDLVNCYLYPRSVVSQMICWNIRGDYNRYLIQTTHGQGERSRYLNDAWRSYHHAYDIGSDHLLPWEPAFLEVSLNLSVLYYDVLGKRDVAIAMLTDDFERALVPQMKMMPYKLYKQSAAVLVLMAENINLWSGKTMVEYPSSFGYYSSDDDEFGEMYFNRYRAPRYNQHPMYNQPAATYNQHAPTYNQHVPTCNQPASTYNQHVPTYTQHVTYNQPAPTYNQPVMYSQPLVYNHPPVYNQPPMYNGPSMYDDPTLYNQHPAYKQ